MSTLVPTERIEKRIFVLRGQKVMLSTDLAGLYGVEPRALVQAVKRNIERFPKDFMFQLSRAEFENLKSQIVTSSWGGLRRATPYAFTEQGVAMLSSVLRSRRAIQVNIEIMRAFVRLRAMVSSYKVLARKVNKLENKYDARFKVVFDAIRKLMEPPAGAAKRPLGFRPPRPRRNKTADPMAAQDKEYILVLLREHQTQIKAFGVKRWRCSARLHAGNRALTVMSICWLSSHLMVRRLIISSNLPLSWKHYSVDGWSLSRLNRSAPISVLTFWMR